MTVYDLIYDIHVLEDEIRSYERKYNMLSEIFYEAYQQGEEPPNDDWTLDWTAWAGVYGLWLESRAEFRNKIKQLQQENQTVADVIQVTARHEPLPVAP